MGTRGYYAICYKGKYHIFYVHNDGHYLIPEITEELEKWTLKDLEEFKNNIVFIPNEREENYGESYFEGLSKMIKNPKYYTYQTSDVPIYDIIETLDGTWFCTLNFDLDQFIIDNISWRNNRMDKKYFINLPPDVKYIKSKQHIQCLSKMVKTNL